MLSMRASAAALKSACHALGTMKRISTRALGSVLAPSVKGALTEVRGSEHVSDPIRGRCSRSVSGAWLESRFSK